MKFKFKLCADDAAKYPDGDKWFTFDVAAIEKKPARQAIALEQFLDGNKLPVLIRDLRAGGTLGWLGAMYLARRLDGVNERWENFDPMVWAADIEMLDDEEEDQEQAEVMAADPTGPVDSPSPTTSKASTRTSSTKRTSPPAKSEE